MTAISKVLKKLSLKSKLLIRWILIRQKTIYLIAKGRNLKAFLKNLLLTDAEIMTICRHCIDMIISRYGSEAYATQYFEYDDFEFIVQYMDLGFLEDEDEDEDDSRICSVFWSLEEY